MMTNPAPYHKEIFQWKIPHPGTLEWLSVSSMEEAMDLWFEGFNIPILVINGVPEPREVSYSRVKEYLKG